MLFTVQIESSGTDKPLRSVAVATNDEVLGYYSYKAVEITEKTSTFYAQVQLFHEGNSIRLTAARVFVVEQHLPVELPLRSGLNCVRRRPTWRLCILFGALETLTQHTPLPKNLRP